MNNTAFTIFGLSVHWYGIMIALGILFAVILSFYTFKQRKFKSDFIFELLIWMIPLAIIGARLYYLIFNNGPWGKEAFAIWNGGLAVYGAVIGGAIGVMIFCIIRKQNFFAIADVIVPCLILGQGIGRIGCYFAGCCYGVETSVHSFPISLKIDDGTWHLATMLYESFFDLIFCLVLVLMLRKISQRGIILGSYLIMYGVLRTVLEIFRDTKEALFIGSSGLKVSMLLSIILIVAGIVLVIIEVVRSRQNKVKKK